MTHFRTGLVLVAALALAACSTGGLGTSDQVYAPGTAPGDAVDGLTVGGRLMDAGEYELALEAYTRAALDHGMTSEVLAGLGTANLALGRLGQSETLLRRAVEQPDATPAAWNNLGVVLMEQDKVAEATLVFRKAYALDSGQSDAIRDNLRLALAKTENPVYGEELEQEYKLVRSGDKTYVIRTTP